MYTDKLNPALEIQQYFIKNNLTLSCAESCSGGLLAAALTHHAGSSKFFIAGLVTYSNQAKNKLLFVDIELIEKFGAVSGEVASLMADNCRMLCQTDYSLSITGIAGPSGDDKTNQVGLIYIGLSCINATKLKKFLFSGTREEIRQQSVLAALEFLLEETALTKQYR